MMNTILASLVMVILSYFSFAAQLRLPEDIPNPLRNPELCGRPNVRMSRICDPDNLISSDSKNVIEGYINAIKTAEIAVVVISQMHSSFIGMSSIEWASENFATQIHNSWKVGDAVMQNGIIIFLSIQDRAIFISTGAGVQNLLSKMAINFIIDHVKPSLRRQNYGDAVERMVVEIDLILSGKKSQISQAYKSSDDEQSSGFGTLLLFLVVIVVLAYSYYENRRVARMKTGQALLERLMKEASDPTSNKFFTTSCPICLEDFPSSTINPMDFSQQPLSPAADRDRVSEEKKNLTTEESIPNSSESKNNSNTNHTNGNGNSTDPKRPMSLQCGHVFCYTCLKEYLKNKVQSGASTGSTVCPICREPVEGNGTARPRPHPADPQARPGSGTAGFGFPPQNPPPDDRTRPSAHGATPSPSSSSDDYPSCNSYSSVPPAATGFGASSSNGYSHPHHYPQAHMHHLGAEMLFRMGRMRYLYPDVMTSRTYSHMHDAIRRGSFQEFQAAAQSRLTEVNHTLADIAVRQAARTSGSRGARGSGSWGGGRSSGGGGGTW